MEGEIPRYVLFAAGVLVAVVVVLLLIVTMTTTGVDRDAYDRGEEVYTIGLTYFGKTVMGGGESPLPDELTFQAQDGTTLSPEAIAQLINPDLRPFVKNGQVYTRSAEHVWWGRKSYWLPANPVTTRVATALRFILREG